MHVNITSHTLKLQDTKSIYKNQLFFHILTMKYHQKEKLRKQYHLQLHQKE